MKQSLLISIYQIVAVALCTFLITCTLGAEVELLRLTVYVVIAMFVLNAIVISLFWKRFGLATRFRILTPMMLLAGSLTPLVSYYTFIADNTNLPTESYNLVLLYALGQASWCLAVEILPELVGQLRERSKNKDK